MQRCMMMWVKRTLWEESPLPNGRRWFYTHTHTHTKSVYVSRFSVQYNIYRQKGFKFFFPNFSPLPFFFLHTHTLSLSLTHTHTKSVFVSRFSVQYNIFRKGLGSNFSPLPSFFYTHTLTHSLTHTHTHTHTCICRHAHSYPVR